MKCIDRIDFGFRIDNIAFRYIPPNTHRTQLVMEEIELGDFNFLSNKWLKLTNIKCEIRKGNPGGVAICSKLENRVKFLKTKSDHDILYAQIEGSIKANKKIDYAKLCYALQKAYQGETVYDIYSIDKRWKDNRSIKLSNNTKIVNPVAQKMSFEPYYELYHHNGSKIQYTIH